MAHNPGFLQLVERIRPHIRECTVTEVKSWLDHGRSVYVVDVREDHEFAEEALVQAIHLGRGILERDIETVIPNKEAHIVLYCGGGYRSALAAASLQEMGYTNVWSMAGGIKAWREAGYPLQRRPHDLSEAPRSSSHP
ncbi:MAG: sulfurtransferase [Nitrospirae bacterium]|nr:MAG: sulfurtransferase [Nitrospirota bacterium]